LFTAGDLIRAGGFETPAAQQAVQDYGYAVLSGKHAVKGEQRMLVILVEFSDVNHTRSADAIRRLAIDESNSYYDEVSYGQVSITGEVYGWYRMDRPMAYYGSDKSAPGDDDNVHGLAQDAVAQLPSTLNLTQYSYLIIVHAGGNQAVVDPRGRSDEIWTACYCAVFPKYATYKPVIVGSKTFENYFFVSEQDGLGSYVHEAGHLFGLPDLYDKRAGGSYVGYWSLMDFGVYCCAVGAAYSPPYIGGWGAALLGWLKPIVPESTSPVWSSTLQPVESPEATTVLIPISQTTYYFIEYRAKIGRDTNLPSSGVVIYYADESVDTGMGILKLVDPLTGVPLTSPSRWNVGSLSKLVFRSGDRLEDPANRVYLGFLGRERPTVLYSSEALSGILLRTGLTTSTESITASYGDMVSLNAFLRDEVGRALSGQNVTLRIANQSSQWRTISDAVTDENGQVSFELQLKGDIGSYLLRFMYDGGRIGDHWYLESARDLPLMITRGKLTISITTPVLNIGDALSVGVWVSGRQGQSLADVRLNVILDGEPLSPLITDSTGKASLVV